jgi:hypothetical protein
MKSFFESGSFSFEMKGQPAKSGAGIVHPRFAAAALCPHRTWLPALFSLSLLKNIVYGVFKSDCGAA